MVSKVQCWTWALLMSLVVDMSFHRHERRFGQIKQNLASLSCAWARVCGPNKPDHLLYTMEKRHCIICNRSHWFFLEQIPFELTKFDPNEYYYSELVEMGFFKQIDDSNSE